MSIKIFKCSPKHSLSEYCNYCRNNVCTMFSAHMITPDALYRCYSSFTSNSDILYCQFFIPFLIKFDFFVTINTHTHTHTHTLGRSVALRIRHHYTSLNFVMNKCSIYVILHSVQGPGVSSRSRKLMFLGSRSQLVHRADNPTAIWADCLANVEFLKSHIPIGLYGLLRG
jgi:hypothetical protein